MKPAITSPYLTMLEAAEYLRYSGANAGDSARQFCRRHGIRLIRRGGGCLLVRQADLEFFLEHGHAPSVALAKRPYSKSA